MKGKNDEITEFFIYIHGKKSILNFNARAPSAPPPPATGLVFILIRSPYVLRKSNICATVALLSFEGRNGSLDHVTCNLNHVTCSLNNIMARVLN